MAEALEETTLSQADMPLSEQQATAPATLWHRLALGGVMLISLFMNLYQLGQNGFGNLYYAAGVRSMLDNWHNFFFVAFDPGGFVSIDKPPLGFWLQGASAKLFGFTPFSVYLPQALAGVLAVALLYHLVRRRFGVVAGLLAALALALSPISVVTNRNNTIDSTLALVLLLGAWAALKAAESGRLRWLLLCAATVGLGFNIKMLEAYLVVPTFGLLYLLAAPIRIRKRIGHLALAGVVLLIISLSWALAVDLTPTAQRPYVGSSQNNSEIGLALGYNGISRLIGQLGLGANRPLPPQSSGAVQSGGLANGSPPFGNTQATASPGGLFDTGIPGPLRLFNEPLGGQIAWLLPLALLGMLALAWQRRPHLQGNRQQHYLVLWGTWLLTMGIFFSVASFFHQYYLTEMAPAIAALFGIGVVTLWHDYRRGGWRGWLLPLALIATALEQIHILYTHPAWGQWLIPAVAILGLLGAAVLIVLRPASSIVFKTGQERFQAPVLSLAILSLLLAPAVWTAIPVIQNVSAQLPVAGPTQLGNFGASGGTNSGASVDTGLVRYLEARQGRTTFLVATANSNTANSIILATNKPVMALGGFSGSDPILTTTQLAALVKNGTVRFFLLSSFGPGMQPPAPLLESNAEQTAGGFGPGSGGPGGGPLSSLTAWVTQHCTVVTASQWQSTSTSNGGTFNPLDANQLYDCATAR